MDAWEAPRTMLVGLNVQVRPVAGDIAEVRVTVPVKPLTGATVMVDVAAAPASAAIDVGLAVTVKSVTVKVTVAEWLSNPLVPVTVTVYVPAEPLHDKVDVCEAPRMMLVGLRLHVRPVAGDMVEVRPTVPVKPLTGATVMVDVPVAPATTVTAIGLAVTVKSRTV